MQVTVPLIVPKAFKAKEALLIDFDLYVKTIRNFCIATGKDARTQPETIKRWFCCMMWGDLTWPTWWRRWAKST